jgi:DNA modification methylase
VEDPLELIGPHPPIRADETRGDDQVRWVQGDNAQALSALQPELTGRVTLAYLDPPFLTGRVHSRVERRRCEQTKHIERTEHAAFDDRWDSLSDYLLHLSERLRLVRTLLADHGSVVVHVDSKTSHYVKVLCDEIFGQDAFVSEIIWRYRRWPAKTKNFQRMHDVLLRYVKDPAAAPRFNQLYEPLAASTLATWGTNKQRAVVSTAGRRLRSSTTEEATPGTPLGDVWEIGIVAPVAKERTGYPTQKPEALLERLVSALSDPGDLVLDPYAGSGTTLAVARRLGRRALGIDQSAEAWATAEPRLAALGDVTLQRVVAARRSRRSAA